MGSDRDRGPCRRRIRRRCRATARRSASAARRPRSSGRVTLPQGAAASSSAKGCAPRAGTVPGHRRRRAADRAPQDPRGRGEAGAARREARAQAEGRPARREGRPRHRRRARPRRRRRSRPPRPCRPTPSAARCRGRAGTRSTLTRTVTECSGNEARIGRDGDLTIDTRSTRIGRTRRSARPSASSTTWTAAPTAPASAAARSPTRSTTTGSSATSCRTRSGASAARSSPTSETTRGSRRSTSPATGRGRPRRAAPAGGWRATPWPAARTHEGFSQTTSGSAVDNHVEVRTTVSHRHRRRHRDLGQLPRPLHRRAPGHLHGGGARRHPEARALAARACGSCPTSRRSTSRPRAPCRSSAPI